MSCITLFWNSYSNSVRGIAILDIVLAVICISFGLIVLFDQCKRINKQKDKNSKEATDLVSKNGNKRALLILFGIQVIVVCILFGTSCITNIIITFLELLNTETDDDSIDNVWLNTIESKCGITNLDTSIDTMTAVNAAVILFGYVGLLCLYFTRLVLLFANTMIEIGEKTKNIFYIAIIIGIINIICTIIFRISMINTITSISMGTQLLIFIALAIYLHNTLIKQFKMISNLIIANYNNNNKLESGCMDESHTQSQSQSQHALKMKKFYDVLIRLTMVSAIFIAVIIQSGLYNKNNQIKAISAIVIQIDFLVNVICISLQFPFMKKYYPILCSICDKKCKKKYQSGM